ncbi:MAG: 4-hydroxyphenylacetate 3-monooxygenase, oxygenase component [Thermaerobacter sp.]|nr:4-hydroxyphenylacetate 3-monooxygenase, oxygenase component [Thermaerobacter sp.]
MGVRTGAQYLHDVNQSPRELWIDGRRITGAVAEDAAFRRLAGSIAGLYDLQHQPGLQEEMTYQSPSSGDRVGLSFLTPRTKDDLARRRRMMQHWANFSGGIMGRTPDYLNSDLMALASASGFFDQNDPRFGENVRRYYEYVRENDLCLTHTLINPQSNRAVGPSQQSDPYIAARILEKTSAGVVVRGARMLATLPLADEILVFPSTVIRATDEDKPYAYAFSLPCATPGLRFICRESFDYGRPEFDHPLASRFEEMDAMVVFDDVLVPWDRVFLLENGELCNRLYSDTDATVHMTHQVVVKNIAKAEFVLGVASTIVDMIGIEQFQHVQEKIAEMIIAVETQKAFILASEANAHENPYGVMTPDWTPLNIARNTFPKIYPRLVEIIQQLGASGLMAIPTERDLSEPTLRRDIDRFYQARNTDAATRIRLFRLAWDLALSSFAGRQVLYERFFFGDPVRMAGALYFSYDKQPMKNRVAEFLERTPIPSPE